MQPPGAGDRNGEKCPIPAINPSHSGRLGQMEDSLTGRPAGCRAEY